MILLMKTKMSFLKVTTYIITSITAYPICLAVPIIVAVVVFNATFNNFFSYIVAVSFIGGENHRPAANH